MAAVSSATGWLSAGLSGAYARLVRNRPKSRPTICSPFSRTMPASSGSSPARARPMLRPSDSCARSRSSIRFRSAPPEGDALQAATLQLFIGLGLCRDFPQQLQRLFSGHVHEAGGGGPGEHAPGLARDEPREQTGRLRRGGPPRGKLPRPPPARGRARPPPAPRPPPPPPPPRP